MRTYHQLPADKPGSWLVRTGYEDEWEIGRALIGRVIRWSGEAGYWECTMNTDLIPV